MRSAILAGLFVFVLWALSASAVATEAVQENPEENNDATVQNDASPAKGVADKNDSAAEKAETPGEKSETDAEDSAGQTGIAAPVQNDAEEEGGETAPQQTDFGSDDDGTQPENDVSEDIADPVAPSQSADEEKANAAENNSDADAADEEKKEDDFPKSPYPEMEGLSDRNFKLSDDGQGDKKKDEKKIRRHTGFYLRLAPALAYMSCKGEGKSSKENLNNPKAQGVAGILDVFVGGAVVEDWILHADLSIAAPFAEVKGVDNRKQINTIGIGLGFTHYFMPHNLYFSSNLSYAQTKMMKNSDGQVQDFDTANGFKVNAAFGKEWWVADQFGLGISGTAFYSWCTKDVLTWNIYGVGAVFTLTYN